MKIILNILAFLGCFNILADNPSFDAQSPCRQAGNLVWDLREQIDYYKTSSEVSESPTEYRFKKLNAEAWSTTNLSPKISWFRITGWVSRVAGTDDDRLLLIDSWDAVKQRKVPSYCLIHPKASQFIRGDYLDCLVYYSSGRGSNTYSASGINYEFIQYGVPDYANEGTLPNITRSNLERNNDSPSAPAPAIPQNFVGTRMPFHLDVRKDFSVAVWFVMDDYNNAWPNLISAQHGAFNIGVVGRTSGGRGVGNLHSGSNAGIAKFNWMIGDGPVILNKKCCVVLTRTGSRVSLFLNGSLFASGNIIDKHYETPTYISVGEVEGQDDSHFHGTISSVKVYSRALTLSELSRYKP